MTRTADGRFQPDKAVNTKALHVALVDVLGLARTARQLDRLTTAAGVRVPTPRGFGSLMLGLRLGLRYNNTNEAMDVGPRSKLSRAQVAYSLYKASTLPTWVVPWVRDQYDGIVLPTMGARRLQIVRWGVKYVGYPYVWGGEWGLGDAPVGARRPARARLRLLGHHVVGDAGERRRRVEACIRHVRTRDGPCPSARRPTWRDSGT